jgi:hypothetical protein
VLQRPAAVGGESRFTTWAYAFAANIALVAARRERWARVPLDPILDGHASPPTAVGDDSVRPDPEQRGPASRASEPV